MTAEFVDAFGQFGPLGLMIAYLVWREKTIADERRATDLARIEADKALAASLAGLTTTIQTQRTL